MQTTTNMTEYQKAKILSEKIVDEINKIDDSMSVKTLANAIAIVINDEYGNHNAEAFLNQLKTKI